MGNIVYKEGSWWIDGTDEIKVRDSIVVSYDGKLTWKKVTVGKDHSGVWHPEPSGKHFDASLWVARTEPNQ